MKNRLSKQVVKGKQNMVMNFWNRKQDFLFCSNKKTFNHNTL